MSEPIRIAMWSGPRNISTAMMRSFGARPDTAVVDEPFYAVYLAQTGLQHPMREEVLASQSQDWREVARALVGPVPHGRQVFYQKHMTHHMLPAIGRDWIAQVRNAFLIRDPAAVLASYIQKRGEATLADIGVVQQRELFEREADRLGAAPPVVEGLDILKAPARMLAQLCDALGIPFTDAMLSWPCRPARDGRCVGAGLVQRRRTVDGIRSSSARSQYRPARRVAAHRRRRATALRGAGGAQSALSGPCLLGSRSLTSEFSLGASWVRECATRKRTPHPRGRATSPSGEVKRVPLPGEGLRVRRCALRARSSACRRGEDHDPHPSCRTRRKRAKRGTRLVVRP